jgi:hypothetical protein
VVINQRTATPQRRVGSIPDLETQNSSGHGVPGVMAFQPSVSAEELAALD